MTGKKGPYYSLKVEGSGAHPTEREFHDLNKVFANLVNGKLVGERIYLDEPLTEARRDHLAEQISRGIGYPVEILGMIKTATGA